jgi:Ca-activated chloride channel family protein
MKKTILSVACVLIVSSVLVTGLFLGCQTEKHSSDIQRYESSQGAERAAAGKPDTPALEETDESEIVSTIREELFDQPQPGIEGNELVSDLDRTGIPPMSQIYTEGETRGIIQYPGELNPDVQVDFSANETVELHYTGAPPVGLGLVSDSSSFITSGVSGGNQLSQNQPGGVYQSITGHSEQNGNMSGMMISGMAPPAPTAYWGREKTDGELFLRDVSSDVEIWVITKLESEYVADEDAELRCGAMFVKLPEDDKEVPLLLKHTDVKGDIIGYIATVNVVQQFHNPYDSKIEAKYVFPLPQNAAVNEFIMTIGERKIRGIIREKEEAEKIYAEAKSQGYRASLLTQQRPNIFTQSVANIEPGKQIDIEIKYFNTLAYVDGWYEFVFPMVVGPRFNPPGSTDGIGAVGRGKAGTSGQSTDVEYLKPGERSGHDISLALNIDAGVAIEDLVCKSHLISNDTIKASRRSVVLSPRDAIPNKDFVLRYKVAGGKVKSSLVTHRDERGGFFTLMLYPPENLKYLQRAPMEMIFVLDCSGSMSGHPIATSKAAMKRALKKLQPDDTFQIIRFSSSASKLGAAPVAATDENIRRALKYVDSLNGSGGTMMIEGIKAALDFEHDPSRLRLVTFMTDGFIGNEMEILGEIKNRLGSARIFSFGIGTSVNRFLLDRMAKLGKGAVAYIAAGENPVEIIDRYYARISHPALTDVSIDWGGLTVSEVYPAQVPDLFVGRPIAVTGRYQGTGSTAVKISGHVGDNTQQITLPVNLDSPDTHPGIASVWARKKIERLVNRMSWDSNPDLPGDIKNTALQYCLMSNYTAFIAVDSSAKTAGNHGVSVHIPVPVPEGVRYDTTVAN